MSLQVCLPDQNASVQAAGIQTRAKVMTGEDLPYDRILQGDCIEVLNALPEKSVDLIFADPPYNLQLKGELHRPNMTLVDRVDDDWDRFDSFAQYDAFTQEWLSACRRVLKDTGTIWVIGSYHNIYRVGKILMDLDFWILNDIVWKKTNPMPNFRGVRFTNANETLLWAQKKQGARYTFNYHAMKRINGGLQMRSVWDLPICSGKERIKIDGIKAHSTQKPEILLHRIITASSNPDEVILDPFFGTGTTGAVAKRLNRHWIGIEQTRIDAITPPFGDDLFIDSPDDKPVKVPFGRLLEFGLIEAGAKIYLDKTGDEATVLYDGSVQAGEHRGSIHRVGTILSGAPCNGWVHWEYVDSGTGERKSIDLLRGEARQRIASAIEDSIDKE
jgi:site-specific DNA-methyltransferase (adenine-specific)